MNKSSNRYSQYLKPFTYIYDLVIVTIMVYLVLPLEYHFVYFYLFVSIVWIIGTINIGYYKIYRFTKGIAVLEKIIKQFLLFGIFCYSFSSFYFNSVFSYRIANYVIFSFLFIAGFKLSVFYLLKKYRLIFGGNFRKVAIVGISEKTAQLRNFFIENPDYGYRLVSEFDLFNFTTKSALLEISSFDEQNSVDEIYCALSDFDANQLNEYIDFADNNLKVLKFIPDEIDVLLKNIKVDYYGYIPILSLREIPLDDIFNQFTKRFFDIFFSIIIIVLVLSWLIPILALFIKVESKGSVFFKQKRNGLNYKEFKCYKFRSMNVNKIADVNQVSKNDPRITKVGSFIRKTSIDELPQFFNVFLGDMSVVGPRPHMISETKRFAEKIDKFMVRHFIKPGITGLAQTNGFRGEVENDKDIIYRVKYDIFYIENWSIILDIKIIGQTVVNIFKGEEKAY